MSKHVMNVGIQPLDEIMRKKDITNHDVVMAVKPGYLNHKQIQKARKGRRLTLRTQEKILEAINAFFAPEEYRFEDIFNYRGKKSIRSKFRL